MPPNERDLFVAALQKAPADRAAFLDEVCRDAPALRPRVDALLKAHDLAGGLLDLPPEGPDPTEGLTATGTTAETSVGPEGGTGPALEPTLTDPPAATAAYDPAEGPTAARPVADGEGFRIGPYKLLQTLGEGGMGVVYLAEQERPVRRKVALKVIKPGMDTDQVVARFEAERQALALMDHPNIARVFDAGATETGRPYFVMELVKGVPVTEHCDRNHLTPRERLELFIPVCQAVQHAHQKVVIHRDLKPSNILVTVHDGKPVPKVIDFGIAKAVHQRLTERTLFTQHGAIMGTLEYMSPEQAEMTGQDVDTRSDVYSLGVLLYELLTGTTPLERRRLREAAFGEILRRIREDEPPKPSTRLSESRDALPSISALRKTEPARLTKLVRGELDWIVMKALEKDRGRRYESAGDFARDVDHYLRDEPVAASPPSASYRLRKFARWYRGLLATAAAVAAVLVVASAFSTYQAVRATRAERVAKDERNRAVEQKDRADGQAAVARAVNDFLTNDLLAEADPSRNARDKRVTVEELLDRASERIAGRFDKQPLVEAAVRNSIGQAYYKLGNYQAAQTHLERSLELRRRELKRDDLATLTSLAKLGWLHKLQGRYDTAEAMLAEVLEGARRKLGEDDPGTLSVMNDLARVYLDRGQAEKAAALDAQALERRRRVRGPDHLETIESLANLARDYQLQNRYEEARSLYAEALEGCRRTITEDHPYTLEIMDNLGCLYLEHGGPKDAEPLLLSALERRRRVLGPTHPDTFGSMNDLAWLYGEQGKYEKAEAMLAEALAGRRRRLGEKHAATLETLANLGRLHKLQGRYATAEPMLTEALEGLRGTVGADHPSTLFVVQHLGELNTAWGRYESAMRFLRTRFEAQRRAPGAGRLEAVDAENLWGVCLTETNRAVEAEPHLLNSLLDLRGADGAPPSRLPLYHDRLTALYERWNKPGPASESRKNAVEAARGALAVMRPDDPERHEVLGGLGRNLVEQKKSAEAETVLRECLALRDQSRPDEWPAFDARSLLGGVLLEQGRYDSAEPLVVGGYEGLRARDAKIPAPDRGRLFAAGERVVQLYRAWGKEDKAEEWRKRLVRDSAITADMF